MSEEQKKIRNLTNTELKEIASILVKGDVKALEEILKSTKGHTVLKVMLARISKKIMADGDMKDLDLLLNRLVGKVKEQIQTEGAPVQAASTVIVNIPANGR
jgi:hypothetical protein